MELGMLIGYLLVFLLLCAALVRALKRDCTTDWYLVLGGEALAAAAAFGAARVFDALPGHGMMPGLTWLGEVLFSLGAGVLYLILLAVTVVICAIKEWKGR